VPATVRRVAADAASGVRAEKRTEARRISGREARMVK